MRMEGTLQMYVRVGLCLYAFLTSALGGRERTAPRSFNFTSGKSPTVPVGEDTGRSPCQPWKRVPCHCRKSSPELLVVTLLTERIVLMDMAWYRVEPLGFQFL